MTRVLRNVLLFLTLVVATFVPIHGASGHADRHRDPNDSPGRFDIAAVETTHTGDKIRFEVSLYDTLHLSDVDLRTNRYFFIGLDLDQRPGDKKLFERCVFIIDRPGVEAIGTDCGRDRLDDSAVIRKGTKAFTTGLDLKRLDVDGDFRFAVVSYWGDQSCPARICVDAAPNRLPLYLEDRTKPTVNLRAGPTPTEPTFPIEFTIKDGKGSGIKRWALEKRALGSDVWETVLTGKGDGTETPDISPGGGTWTFRVTATDKQGNSATSTERELQIPYDDPEFGSFSTFGGSGAVTSVLDAQDFGGSHTSLAKDATMTMTLETLQSGTSCPRLRFYGPGADWVISLAVDGGPAGMLTGPDPGPRQQWHTRVICPGVGETWAITVTSDVAFGIDYVSIEGGSLVPQP